MTNRGRLLVIASFGLVALVCLRLGFWQLARLEERRAANTLALAARSAPLVNLGPSSLAMSSTELHGRLVRATGHYDHTHDLILRGRAYNGVPGVEIVTPLVLEGGRAAVLVNRGFIPAPDAVTVQPDSVREFGTVRVTGTAFSVPSGRGQPLDRGSYTTWARLDLEALRDRLPYLVAPVYIRQSPDSAVPAFPRRLKPLPIDDGPHLNYAIQWFAFAGMAVVFGAVILKTTEKRQRANSEM